MSIGSASPLVRRTGGCLVFGSVVALGVILVAGGCGRFPDQDTSAATPMPSPAPDLRSSTATPAPRPTPDLSARPLVWFAPLPPMAIEPGRPFIGAQDYMDLFQPGAPWPKAIGRVDVFELYGGWAAYAPWTVYASDEELQQTIEFVNRNGLALAMENSPILRPADCGTDAESWGGLRANLETAHRIKKFGGTLRFVAMDAPYYYTSLVNYPGACRWPAERVARQIAAYIQGMQGVFPEVVIGDTEPLQAAMDPAVYMDWMRAFRQTAGYNLPFLHMDIDYARRDWAERVKELEDYAHQQGIDFGILYFGNWDDLTDEAWLSSAGERVKRYELAVGGQPDHVLFQSWHDHPNHTLPETAPYTYTAFINQYFDNKSGLGFRNEGAGANVGVGKEARASRALPDQPPENAVDGNPSTVWGAGDFAPNWIEIDLGQPYTISEIRLRLSQSPAGRTIHSVSVRGPRRGDPWIMLHTFDGETRDLDQLAYALPEPMGGIQFVRAEVTLSPSWIAFREIEVIAAK